MQDSIYAPYHTTTTPETRHDEIAKPTTSIKLKFSASAIFARLKHFASTIGNSKWTYICLYTFILGTLLWFSIRQTQLLWEQQKRAETAEVLLKMLEFKDLSRQAEIVREHIGKDWKCAE